MKKIYVPGSFCPLHLWHEEFIEKIVSKTNKDLYFSIKWWSKIIDNILKLNNNWRFDENLKKLRMKEGFLNIEDVIFMFNEIYPDFDIWIDTRDEIIWERFDGIALWSDQLTKILSSIKLWKRKNFKFKKVYLFNRKGVSIWNYNHILKSSGFDIEVIELWQSSYDLSSSQIIEIYYQKGLSSIKDMVSNPIYNFIQNIV